MTSRTLLKATASAVAITAGCGVASTALANDDVLAHIAAGNTVMPSIDYNGWNYSPFDQITTENVANLTIAWTLQLGILDQWEASPLIVGNTMYVASPVNQSTGTNQVPNVLIAIDVETQRILWEFRPDVDRERGLQACCGAQTRGLNYAEGNVYYTTIDGQSFALDGETGEALWRTMVADVTIREHSASNAIIIDDLYIVGNQGGEYGVRGKVTALNIHSGQTQWVMYNMGPDNEVGVGPRLNTFYADDQQGSLRTWFGDSWRRGGGTSWGYFTADLERNMFFYSTGNCGPWNPDYRREWGVINLDERGGLIDYRNNWCASQMARDATTGELIWAFNISPADNWDLDEPLITPLITVSDGSGGQRDVAVKTARNGYHFVWDRDNGELVREPFPHVYVDYITGYDMTTGRALHDITRWSFTHVEDRRRYTDYNVPGAEQRDDYTGTEIAWCPGISARNWQNDAFSPQTGLLYTPLNLGCATQVVVEGEYVAGEGYTLRRGAGTYPGGGARDPDRHSPTFGEPIQGVNGQLVAINPDTSEAVFRVNWAPNNNVPIMASAGGLLFQGGSNAGVMRALDASNGDILWEFRVGSQFSQSPISYIGPDGRQYIAIIASSASTGNVTVNTAQNAAARYARAGTTLFVFALPQAVAGN